MFDVFKQSLNLILSLNYYWKIGPIYMLKNWLIELTNLTNKILSLSSKVSNNK